MLCLLFVSFINAIDAMFRQFAFNVMKVMRLAVS